MLEQEIASVIKYVIEKSGNPYPYYDEVPEGFLVPAVYFPVPEIVTGADTLSTYKLTYLWFIGFFHKSKTEAYDLAMAVLKSMKDNRGQIPVIAEDGTDTGKAFYVKNPKITVSDEGVVQLIVEWDSRRFYTSEAVLKMREYFIDKYVKK